MRAVGECRVSVGTGYPDEELSSLFLCLFFFAQQVVRCEGAQADSCSTECTWYEIGLRSSLAILPSQ